MVYIQHIEKMHNPSLFLSNLILFSENSDKSMKIVLKLNIHLLPKKLLITQYKTPVCISTRTVIMSMEYQH